MITYNEETHIALSARRYLYELFHTLFGTMPTVEIIDALDLDVTQQSFSIALSYAESDRNEVARFMADLQSSSHSISALQREYSQVFEGPESLPAPPWESVYTNKKRLLFQESTLKVRNIYRAQGLLPALYPHVADDHISLELDYLSHLAQQALNSFEEEREDTYIKSIVASRTFIAEHLSQWIDPFASDISTWKDDSLYASASRVLSLFVHNDGRFLERWCIQ